MCKQLNMVDMKQQSQKNKKNIKNKIRYDIKTQKVLCANVQMSKWHWQFEVEVMSVWLVIWSKSDVVTRLSWVQEPDGLGEETPPKSLSFCHQAVEALTRWQQSE